MSEATQFTIGGVVQCRDGACGELVRVVVDPVARALTHLVVEPRHQPGRGRLVPIDLVESAHAEIVLRSSMSEFEGLEDAEETRFLPGAASEWGYGEDQVISWPYYALGMDGLGPHSTPLPSAVTYDRVPVGEVELRRGEHVHATDGEIGRVQGLVIDPSDHHVTHVLLDEGHLWGQKQVAIPISAVKDLKAGARLTLTKDEVRDLPSVDIVPPSSE
jgi:sporulation protein YlmC with PRC-barrel domain